jgi:serine/threonine protein kinase
MVSARSALSAVTDFMLQASGLGLDLEIYRELGVIKTLVISRYQRLHYEELNVALKNATSKEARRKINTDLTALQYTAASAPPLPPLKEIQSRVDALLMRLEKRELLLDLNEGISSSLCELSRRGFMQLIRHFECGLVVPTSPGDGLGAGTPSPSFPYYATAMYRHGGVLLEGVIAERVGRIYRGFSSIIHEEVVVKVDNEHHDLAHEVLILKTLGRDPSYAVTFLEHISSGGGADPDYMILKSFGEPLSTFFTSKPVRRGGSSFELLQLEQIVRAVEWLHNKAIVHCDLKPENILVHDQGRGSVAVKLCDFDSAVRIDSPWKIYSSHERGQRSRSGGLLKYSQDWVSPEVYLFNLQLSRGANMCTDLPSSLFSSLFLRARFRDVVAC